MIWLLVTSQKESKLNINKKYVILSSVNHWAFLFLGDNIKT